MVDVKGIKVTWYLNCFGIGHWIVHCGFQHIVMNDVQSFSSVRVTSCNKTKICQTPNWNREGGGKGKTGAEARSVIEGLAAAGNDGLQFGEVKVLIGLHYTNN